MKLSKTDKEKLSKIAASLELGPLHFTKKRKKSIYIYLAISIFCPLLIILAISMAYITGSEWDGSMTLGILMSLGFGLFFSALFLVIYLADNKIIKKVLLWSEDAIELKAEATAVGKCGKQKTGADAEDIATVALVVLDIAASLGTNGKSVGFGAGAGGSEPFKVKIKVIFMYEGKKLKKISGNPNYKSDELKYNTKSGYSTDFVKYINRKIDILYSPKYDQVLILKES